MDNYREILKEEEDLEGDWDWHFRYNRRLSQFAHAVSSLTFSQDGRYLVSGTGSGDVKIWDTGCWAETTKLRGCRKEEPKCMVISPAQRWLVIAYPAVLYIFNCKPPWRLEQALPALIEPATKEVSDWCCIAFSPMAEVDHPGGCTGQDNHLATCSTEFLCVLDYSGGWGVDTPRRTRSLMQSAQPTSICYTACGWWLIAGFESGQLQIWNAFSLTLEKTLSAHTATVNGLDSSPRAANYESRLVSCGLDQTIRVWHSNGWLLEQHCHDTRCDRAGVRQCTFSSKGNWLVSVSTEMSVWRVGITVKGRMILNLHQRLGAVCGAEGLRTAAFCGLGRSNNSDAIAVGSRDGVLGLWTKYPGAPPDPVDGKDSATTPTPTAKVVRSTPWHADRPLPRPMQLLSPGGIKPPTKGASPGPSSRGEWFQRAHLRSLSMSQLSAHRHEMGSLSAASSAGRLTIAPGTPTTPTRDSDALLKLSDFSSSWKVSRAHSYGFEDARMHLEGSGEKARTAGSLGGALQALGDSGAVERASPMRLTMRHACRGLVHRISLDPKVITDNENLIGDDGASCGDITVPAHNATSWR